MKIYETANGYEAKRKNIRVKVFEGDNTIFIDLTIFDKENGHFARTLSENGIKTTTMRLTKETASILCEFLRKQLNR